MTWIKGTTTWGDLPTDLTKLICGEITDGVGVTVAAGDRWVRDVTRTVADAVLNSTTTLTSATAAFTTGDVGAWVIATGLPASTAVASVTNATTVVLSKAATASASGVSAQICLDTIRTPAAKDVATGLCANRTGYFTAGGVPNTTSPMSIPATSVCRVTAPYTSEATTVQATHRWVTQITVNSANTVPGNYSTATLSVLHQGEINTVSAAPSAITSAGVVALPSFGASFTMSDPSGILQVGAVFYRAFSSTHMYGVDAWPMLPRAAGATTFGTAPPGVAGTDYDIVVQGVIPFSLDRGGLFCGLGIKTATGLGVPGALYTVNENMALAKCRIFASATAGILSLDLGNSRTDLQAPGTIRCVNGSRILSWCRPFQTAGSVTTTSAVQYFLSVKNDGIMLVLNGDTAASGKLSTAYIGTFTPVDSTYDVLPVVANYITPDYTADRTDTTGVDWQLATQYAYWSLRRRQDGSEGARDWQTRWMRGEAIHYPGTSGGAHTDITTSGNTQTDLSGTLATYALSAVGGAGNPLPVFYPARQNKPGPDGKWWTYGYSYAESAWTSTGAQVASAENRFIRGTQNSRYLLIPGDGWGSGDELTDTGTGAKYLLVIPDYPGLGCRIRVAANSYFGGLAVLET